MKNFNYFLKEGISNLFTNKVVTLTTVITVVVSLLIIGIFNIISLNMVYISDSLGNNFEFNIYIKDEIPQEQLEAVAEEIRSVENVKSAKLNTKSQTLKKVQSELGDTSALKGITEKDNPFRNGAIVTVTDLSKSEQTINIIKQLPQIDSVSNNVETSKKIDAITKKVRLYSIISYLLLSVLCLSIVSNIINVSIFSRRKHINIMKYVGATNRFVKIPFIIEGAIIGLLGAIFSVAILFYGYYCLFGNFNHGINGLQFLAPYKIAQSLGLVNTVYGVIIGTVGASLAVNKHLKV